MKRHIEILYFFSDKGIAKFYYKTQTLQYWVKE